MRIGIVGSRRWHDRKAVEELVNVLPLNCTIVSGGCDGVDTWAKEAADMREMDVIEYLPNLPPDGSPHWEFTKAYHARNRQIAENIDVLYAFVAEDRRGGTENTIKHALALDVRVEVIMR
tara:strand:- start:247 stop:606 length:360 start_codon:yes stop_codon:yes gene_type:complete